MKEVVFIRKNIEKWQKVQKSLKHLKDTSPEELADTYLDISADLAFAQTHYPESEVVPYLNSMALRMHNAIYGHRQQRWQSILAFWTHEIPQEVYRHRKLMLLSFIIFWLSTLIGVVSTSGDKDFAVNILGRSYIEMTLQNINSGHPMAVYGSSPSGNMWAEITINNILVSFYTYISGMLTCFCTGLMLLKNGVMAGTFMTFCQQHSVLNDCLMAMWLHGVIEITSLIIAGGAGLILGCGWMFPGSLPRITSFRLAAKSSVKIITGLIPFFIIAGFIESYITRHTEWGIEVRLTMIAISCCLMFYYFIYRPWKVGRGLTQSSPKGNE